MLDEYRWYVECDLGTLVLRHTFPGAIFKRPPLSWISTIQILCRSLKDMAFSWQDIASCLSTELDCVFLRDIQAKMRPHVQDI